MSLPTEPTASTSKIPARPGLEYVLNKITDKSHFHMEVTLLIPNFLEGSNAPELLEAASAVGETVYYVIDSTNTLRSALSKEKDVKRLFKLYSQKTIVPWNLADFCYYKWLCRIMVPHVIMTASKFVWRGVKLHMLLRSGSHSLNPTILKTEGLDTLESIKQDMDKLLANADNFFCFQCSSSCALKSSPFHFSLHKLMVVKFAEELAGTSIFTELSLFDDASPSADKFLLKLRTKYDEFDEYLPSNPRNVMELLTELLINASAQQHCCYLVLILQGPGMPESTANSDEDEDDDGREEFHRLLQKENVYRFLYAGVTHGKTFRKGHLTDPTSPILNVLTKNAKMVILRESVFESRAAAKQNEACIIEILKSIVRRTAAENEELNFWLLNKHSGPASLLPNKGLENKILTFVESNKVIFSTNTTAANANENPEFVGNYALSGEFDFKGKHKGDVYADVESYVEAIKHRNLNGIFHDSKRPKSTPARQE